MSQALYESVQRAVAQGLRLFPLPLESPEEAAQAVEHDLLWFAALPETAFWLRNGAREQSIMDASGALHRVDLLVNSGSAGLVAIDYKTGSAHPSHHEQVRRYMRLLAEAQELPVRGVLVYFEQRLVQEVLP